MESQVLSEEIEWQARRVAVAFGVVEWDIQARTLEPDARESACVALPIDLSGEH